MEDFQPKCIICSIEMIGAYFNKKYCSTKCKSRYWAKNKYEKPVTEHDCRVCGTTFPIGKGQSNKWICSINCIRASRAKSVRTFHQRRPQMESIYRQRTKEKVLPDGNQVRFYRNYPHAPHSCESCGESRVLEIAHKLGHERLGERRLVAKQKWPEMVWMLCPTCHRLLDRMNYSPEELGLKI